MLFDRVPLEPDAVLVWLDVCCRGLQHQREEASKLLNARLELPEALLAVLPIGASEEEVAEYLDSSRRELELAAILTIIAAAEARIRTDARTRGECADELAQRLKALRAAAPTEWGVRLYEDGIIDAWKAYIGKLSDLGTERARLLSSIGRFKNLLNVRHWVAHGRNGTTSWGIGHYTPDDVADIIHDLFDALRKVADHRNLMAFK